MIKALKSCRFMGKNYSAGDRVPEAAIEKKMIGALVRMKLIALEDEPPPAPKPKPKLKARAKQDDLLIRPDTD